MRKCFIRVSLNRNAVKQWCASCPSKVNENSIIKTYFPTKKITRLSSTGWLVGVNRGQTDRLIVFESGSDLFPNPLVFPSNVLRYILGTTRLHVGIRYWSTTHQIYIEFGTHALDVKMHISYADGHWARFFLPFLTRLILTSGISFLTFRSCERLQCFQWSPKHRRENEEIDKRGTGEDDRVILSRLYEMRISSCLFTYDSAIRIINFDLKTRLFSDRFCG